MKSTDHRTFDPVAADSEKIGQILRKEFPRIRVISVKGEKFYQVDCRKTGTNGKRPAFKTIKEANQKAKEVAASINAEGFQGMAIKADLRVMALKAEAKLLPFKKTIDDAVLFYVQHLEERAKIETTDFIKNLTTLYVAAKEHNTLKPLRPATIKDLKDIKALLDKNFGEFRIAEVEKSQIEKYLKGMTCGNKRKKNILRDFNTFWNWCIKEGKAFSNPLSTIWSAPQKLSHKL